ncbi:chemotaxis protein CheW [Pleurocapsa sp. PCC 7319]|uniref:chemotaxis protein CheW n=1 Tax=Pleurocapsa sp. PCC 7319 TaxID=118161 RepID=UPI00036524F3|nr:chemotaxis protein CheW [Pleurocapsa sp. PCC 7319]
MTNPSPASRIQDNLPELFKANLAPGDAYIRFQLTSNITALISMQQVQGSLIVDAQKVTPLPSMPEFVIGMINSRDRVFCLFDLAQLLTLPSDLSSPRQYQVIVLQTVAEQPIYIGLAVSALQGIVRLTAKQIQSSLDTVVSNLTAFTSGTVQEQEITIPVLEFNRILKALTAVEHN